MDLRNCSASLALHYTHIILSSPFNAIEVEFL
jgi:hypothetical protein